MILAPPQSPDLQAQFQNAMTGVLRRPGRSKRKGQWVNSGGEFNNLTEGEIYGRLRARQGGNSGSGPGGGLRSGGLSGESGIDWVKRNGPSRSPSAREAVIAASRELPKKPDTTATTPPPTQGTTSTTQGTPDILTRPVGEKAPPPPAPVVEAGPPASAAMPAPVEPLRITNVNGNSENTKGDTSKFVNGVDWSGGTSQPPPAVLQKPAPQAFVPDAKTKLAQSMEDVKNMQSKDRSDAVMARAKAAIDLKTAPTDVNSPEFQEWQKTDPDAIANRDRAAGARASLEGFVNRGDAMKESAAKNMETNAVGADRGFQEALVDKGMRFDPAASIQTGKERAAGLRSSMTHPLPPPVLQKPASSPIKAAGANQIAPIVADTSALGNGEAQKPNPFAKKPLDNRLTAGLASNKRDKFSNKNPFV